VTQSRWRVFSLLVLLMAALPLGCDAPGKPDSAERPLTPDQVVSFTALYRANCSGCHGADGKLGPAPPLNDPLFRGIVGEADLEKVIASGRSGTPMPAFARENGGTLTALQVQILVKEIKGVSYKIVSGEGGKGKTVVASTTGTQPHWGTPPAATSAPPYALAKAAGDPKKGARVFTRACAGCHGQDGQGDEGDESRLRINDPAFLALISDQALRRIVITGRPDLGMPSYAGKRPEDPDFEPLTSEEVTDLVALMASWAPERPGRGKATQRRPAGPAKGLESRRGR